MRAQRGPKGPGVLVLTIYSSVMLSSLKQSLLLLTNFHESNDHSSLNEVLHNIHRLSFIFLYLCIYIVTKYIYYHISKMLKEQWKFLVV